MRPHGLNVCRSIAELAGEDTAGILRNPELLLLGLQFWETEGCGWLEALTGEMEIVLPAPTSTEDAGLRIPASSMPVVFGRRRVCPSLASPADMAAARLSPGVIGRHVVAPAKCDNGDVHASMLPDMDRSDVGVELPACSVGLHLSLTAELMSCEGVTGYDKSWEVPIEGSPEALPQLCNRCV